MTPPVWLHRVCLLTTLSTVILLGAGALVTSTGSGLAVPDWPLSFGTLLPPMIGGVLYEHGHRLIAGWVATLTVIQFFLIAWREPRRWVKGMAAFALLLVLAQAALGGITVLFRLPPQVSIAHACLAQIFFSTVVTLSLVTSPAWSRIRAGTPIGALPFILFFLSIGFFAQLVLGATMRHTGAGLVIPDFPLSFGEVIPTFANARIVLAFGHRSTGILLSCCVFILAAFVLVRHSEKRALLPLVGGITALVILQVTLGGIIVWARRPIPVTSLHLVVGAVCLGLSVASTVAAFRYHWISKSNIVPNFQEA